MFNVSCYELPITCHDSQQILAMSVSYHRIDPLS